MSFDLLAANAAPALSLTQATVATFLLGIITLLLGIVAWFLQREIKSNDEAHKQLKAGIDGTRRELKAEIDGTRRELKADIKALKTNVQQLLVGQSRIEGLLQGRHQALADGPPAVGGRSDP